MTSVVGIALGPFVGGAIQTNQDPLNWHWIYWIQLIVCGGLLPVFWFLLRETRGDVILMKKAKKIRKETGRDVYAKAELDQTSILTNVKVSFLRPTKMLVTEFVVISFTLWVSFGESPRQASLPFTANFQLGDSSSSSSPVFPKRSAKSES
jgi:MFS family permease